ncbi:MAG: MobA/MobL family protein [Candidatus Omnitrophota bacterium]
MDPTHFHCQYKKFSRSKGQAAVQAAAYRLGMKLEDRRTGLTHNYTRKGGVKGTLTVTPSGVNVPAWVHDPESLWNAVEAAEKDNPRALVMHEWEIALPHQLNEAQRQDLAQDMARFIANRYGCVAMAAFHDPNRNGDQRNHHVHLMFTPRAIEWEGFSKNKFRNYAVRAPEAEEQRCMTGAEEIVYIRSQWAAIGNRHLERAGFAPDLDHRSYEDQGIDLEPQKHMGPDATAKERRGERTAKGDFNRAVKDRNQNRLEWARAWEQAKIDITGHPLPDPEKPPARPEKPFARVADPKAHESTQPRYSKAFLNLMENQKHERTSLIGLHITEKKNLWREEQVKRQLQKREWAKLYRLQRKEREALLASQGTLRRKILQKLDFTGRLKKGQEKALENLERRQKIERAQMGREFRAALRDPAHRLEEKHVQELAKVDRDHLAQRKDLIARELRNREALQRMEARERSRDKDRGPGRER